MKCTIRIKGSNDKLFAAIVLGICFIVIVGLKFQSSLSSGPILQKTGIKTSAGSTLVDESFAEYPEGHRVRNENGWSQWIISNGNFNATTIAGSRRGMMTSSSGLIVDYIFSLPSGNPNGFTVSFVARGEQASVVGFIFYIYAGSTNGSNDCFLYFQKTGTIATCDGSTTTILQSYTAHTDYNCSFTFSKHGNTIDKFSVKINTTTYSTYSIQNGDMKSGTGITRIRFQDYPVNGSSMVASITNITASWTTKSPLYSITNTLNGISQAGKVVYKAGGVNYVNASSNFTVQSTGTYTNGTAVNALYNNLTSSLHDYSNRSTTGNVYYIMGKTSDLAVNSTIVFTDWIWKVKVVAAPVTFSIFVDPTAPKTTLLYTPAYGTNYVNNATMFTLSASDGSPSSGVKYTAYRIDGGSWKNYTTPFNLTTVSNGTHAISYNSTDNVGNVETTKTLTVRLDKTAPVTSCTYTPAYDSNWVNATTTFTITPSDAGCGVRATYYKLDSGLFYTSPGPFNIGNLTNGLHVISYYSVDNVGNAQTTQSVNVQLDKTAPTTSIGFTPMYTSGSKNWVTTTTMFNLTATDNTGGSGVQVKQWRFSGSGAHAWTQYTAPFSLSGMGNGTYTIQWCSWDNVGNNESVKSATVFIDTIQPTTGISYFPAYGTNWVNTATPFTIIPSDADSGMKATYYKEDSGLFYLAPVGAFTLGNLTNGTHVISYYSVDNAGNVQTTQSITVRLDLIAPTTSITYTPVYAPNWVNATTTFTITPSDAGCGVKATYYKLDGGAFYRSPGSFTIGNLTNGTIMIYYYSVDYVGNMQSMQSVSVKLDKSAPVTACTYTPAYAPNWVNAATMFTITPSDAGCGVKATYYKLDGGAFYTSPGSFTIGNLTDDTHTIYYYSVDYVGNTQSTQSVTIKLDKSVPTSALSFIPHYGTNYVNTTTSFMISANDAAGSGVGAIYYKTDLITWKLYSAPFTLNGYPNGTYTIKYYSVDSVNNTEQAHQSIVHLDIIGPTIVITSPTNRTYGSATITVILSHSDPDYNYSWYTITNLTNQYIMVSNKTWLSPSTSDVLTNGIFRIDAWGNDTYGNIKKATSVFFSIDTTAGIPQIQLILPANTTYTSTNLLVEVQNFTKVDTAWFRYNINGGSWHGNYTLHYNETYWVNNTILISLADGHYYIQVNASRAGYVALVNRWFTIDTTPPVTTINVHQTYQYSGTNYLNSSSTIQFTVADLSAIKVTRFWFDAQTTWHTYVATFSIGAYELSDGFHTIYFNSTDIANNNETTKSTQFYLDTVAPDTTISYTPSYGPNWINNVTDITITPSDVGSGVKITYYKEDSGFFYLAPAGAFTLGNLTSGTHMISFYSVDNVGNVQTTQSVTVRLDLNAPITSIVFTLAYGPNYVNALTTFSIIPNDTESGTKATFYKIDGGLFYTSPGSFSVGNFTEGTHTIYYYSVDNVDNVQKTQSIIIKLDKTAPITSCTYITAYGTNWVNTMTMFTINPSDGTSGVKTTYYRLDSGSFYISPGTFNIGNLTDGTHTISYYSVDNVGNVQTAQSFTVQLDKNAPITTISYAPHFLSNFVNASIIFTLSASDFGTGASGVNKTMYRVDNSAWMQYFTTFSLASYVNGTHVIYYYSNDSAGNNEGIKSLSVRLDKNSPVTTIIYTRHRISNFVNATATFTLSATDAGAGESGVNHTFYHVDSDPWLHYSVPFNLASFANGTHVIYYYSNDSAGNYEGIKTLFVRLDKNPPVTNISYAPHYAIKFVSPSTTFTLSAIDYSSGESGVNQTLYMVDSSTWIRYTGPFSLAAYANKTHTIFYYSNDSAGNYETIKSILVYLDRNPPFTQISFTPSQGSNIVNDTTIFTLFATDAGTGESGVNQTFYRVDGNPWSQYIAPFTLAALANGTHTIYYYSNDSCGNTEMEKSTVVQLGKTPTYSPGPTNNLYLILILLIAAGAVITAIAIAVHARRSHSREPTVEPNLTQKEILSRLKHLFVFHRTTGTCIMYQPFTQTVFDPQLIAGFLSAITSFGSEIQADAKLRVLEYQSFKILMEETEHCTYALLLGGDLVTQIKDLYHQFIFAFETAFSDEIAVFDGELTPFKSATGIIKNIFNVNNLPESNL